jgi:NTP pyrophosphatase (non-canonical NTP hydrolase)
MLFNQQQQYQKLITGEITPQDNVKWFSYHIQAIQEEIGEVLKADKRWKTHRNAHYDKANKLEELADLFITAINIALFSGFGHQEIEQAIINKINENTQKYERGAKNDSNS